MASVKFRVLLPKALHEEAKAFVAGTGLSLSDLLRVALRRYLDLEKGS